MNNIFLLFVALLLAAFSPSVAQDIKTDMEAYHAEMAQHSTYSLQMNHTAFDSLNTSGFNHTTTTVYKSGDKMRVSLNQQDIITTENQMLVVDHTYKEMTFYPNMPPLPNAAKSLLPNLNRFFEIIDTTVFTLENNLKKYHLELLVGDVRALDLFFDATTHLLVQSTEHYANPNNNNGLTKMIIQYTLNTGENSKITTDKFSVSTFVKPNGNSFTITDKYTGYTLEIL